MKYFLPFVALLLVLSPANADVVTVDQFTFDCPFPEAKFERLGPSAYSATWPSDKPYKEAAVEMIVTRFDAEAVKLMAEGGGKPYLAALSTYMGIYGKPESVNKTLFFGSTSARREYNSNVPRKHVAHVYSKNLEDGSFVLVGIRVYQPSEIKYGDLLRSVANTFKVKK